jgi:hypothetical protein
MKKPAITLIAALALIATAHATDNPSIKEGFWTVHSVTTDNPGNKVLQGAYSICRNHAFDHHLDDAVGMPGCTVKSDSVQGNKHVVEMVCHAGATTIVSKTVNAYLSDTHVHTETDATYTPPMMGHTQENMVIDWTYAGSCPAGIQPGDRVNQNGAVMHLWKH